LIVLRDCLGDFYKLFLKLYNEDFGKDDSFVVIPMKRVIAFILMVLYLSTSMGATVYMHYCMGHLVAWGLVDHESKDCVACGMAKGRAMQGCSVGMKDCCHDDHKQFQSDRAQKPAQGWAEWNLTPAFAVLPCAVWNEPAILAITLARPVANGPPLAEIVPVFLRNCNFRI
jgi:hypothetical protein